MVTAPVGRVEAAGLWKHYRRGRQFDSLRDLLPAITRALFSRGAKATEGANAFWAVRDVSFNVGPGETLGIIGHNGAGKSTVLKLLTRVTRPTQGECRVTGRMGALVEIAAGFHPDLTGRENVQLQGAILGMSRAEITNKFSDIVDFSGISEFIDTPVKRYSTGMMARLGFSIAAHIDPDVLIIDEILSVGDLAFQTQAFDRIKQLAQSGRPVIVVSHQLSFVEELCKRVIIMDKGAVAFDGPSREAVAAYIGGRNTGGAVIDPDAPVRFHSVNVLGGETIRSGDIARVAITGELNDTVIPSHIEPLAVLVRNAVHGNIISIVGSQDCSYALPARGAFAVEASLQMNVPPGIYSLEALGWDKKREVGISVGPTVSINVTEGPRFLGTVQLRVEMSAQRNSGTSRSAP